LPERAQIQIQDEDEDEDVENLDEDDDAPRDPEAIYEDSRLEQDISILLRPDGTSKKPRKGIPRFFSIHAQCTMMQEMQLFSRLGNPQMPSLFL
jgi:hypothetical protein